MHQRIISISGILTMGLGLVVASCSSSSSTTGVTPEGGTPPGADGGGPSPDGGPGPGMDGGPGPGMDGGPGGNDSGPGGNDGGPTKDSGGKDSGPGGHAIKTVFIIMEENHNWSSIKGSSSAPYINSLLALGGHAENYKTPPGNHPSEPNYVWLEAGSNLGITDDSDPSANHQSTTAHLVTQMKNAGVTWKAYAEDISGSVCPLTATGKYAPKHTPMVFFDDVTNSNSPSAPECLAKVRPFTELASDLSGNKAAQYNFITPNLDNDMHDGTIQQADTWLSTNVPVIQASSAYKNGGVIFIIWDEGGGGSDGPMGWIVLSSLAKAGFSSSTAYTHSATVRTVQEIFSLSPFLGGAAGSSDMKEFFTTFP